MKNIFPLFLIIIGVFSCQSENTIFSEHQELSPNFEWVQKDFRIFKVPVKDLVKTYQQKITFRYAEGFANRNLIIWVTETSPTGKKNEKEYSLEIVNQSGAYIGDPGFDIWDSEHLIETKKKYTEKGTYTYEIKHNMPINPVNMAMEIGLIVEKNK